MGGSALMNQGIHGFDVFRSRMGPVRRLAGCARTLPRPIEAEDPALAVLECQNGAVDTLEGSTSCYPGYPRRIEICVDKGSVVLEEDAILRWDCNSKRGLPVGKAAQNVVSAAPRAINADGHIRRMRRFMGAMLDGDP